MHEGRYAGGWTYASEWELSAQRSACSAHTHDHVLSAFTGACTCARTCARPDPYTCLCACVSSMHVYASVVSVHMWACVQEGALKYANQNGRKWTVHAYVYVYVCTCGTCHV